MQSLRLSHRSWIVAQILALGIVGCASSSNQPPGTDPPDEDPITDPPPAGECKFEGTFTVDSIEIIKGACTLQVSDTTLEMRQASDLLFDFQGTSWRKAASDAKTCQASFDGPDNWYYNGTLRSSHTDIVVAGDKLTAEMTDFLQGTDDLGNTCDVTYRILATRTGPPSAGNPVGSSCGPVGCNGTVCAFGSQYECASGICLLTTLPVLDTMCTEPCDPSVGCSDGLVCKKASQVWDGAADGYYCARFFPVCGNGVLEGDEACDDGNTTGGDGCSADCKANETCGDGVVQTPKGEQCESTASQEWLTCTADCKLDAPAGVFTPLPIDAFQPEVAAAGAGVFFVGGTVDRILEPQNNYEVYVARTIDSGANWTKTQFSIPDGFPELGAIAAQGQKVAVAILDSFIANGFWLSESTNGGATYGAPTFQSLPEGKVQGIVGGEDSRSLRLHHTADGGFLALTALNDTVVVSRRAPGQTTWQTTGKISMPNPGSACTYWWQPPRFDTKWAPGVFLHDDGQRIRVTAGQACGASHSALTFESTDNGATFGPMVDLVAEAGLMTAEQVNISPSERGTFAVCLVGTNAMAMKTARCATDAPSGSAWAFSDTGATWDNAFVHAPETATSLGPNSFLFTQISYQDQAILINRSSDGGSTWSQLSIANVGYGTRRLFPVSADVLWLFEVDGQNDASLVRLSSGGSVAAPREWLFGDARRLNGTYPWGFSAAHDTTGAMIMAFAVPDAVRKSVMVARILK